MSLRARDLSIRGLTKAFGTNTVLDDINLDIRGGEFVGVMGPNGAGKSTLIKILDGVYTATAGEVRLGGERVSSLGGRSDVGFIHQDLGLIDELSITENLRLGRDPLRLAGPILNVRAEHAAAERALALVGLENLSVDRLVGDLAPGEKTLVAIARAFDRGASIVFVDEATSTLPPGDSRRVIEALEKTITAGATVVMVTHKLSEILDACQRVVVLLDGRLAADEPIVGLDRAALVKMLLQHETSRADRESAGKRVKREAGETLLQLREACGGRAGPVDLEIRAGEVLGLTGLPGSGLHDVAFLAYGSLRPSSGKVEVKRGVRRALVPPHRETQGGFTALTVRQNITLAALSRWRTKLRVLGVRRERLDAMEMVRRLSVRPERIDVDFDVLSGGNKQKVIFGRALFNDPEVYVLCEPTRGVDVGTRSEIYRLIRELSGRGAGILVVSSDAEDLFAVCDRVGVIENGRLGVALSAIDVMDMAELEAMI